MKSKNTENSEVLQITQIKLKLSPTKEIELTSDEARKVYEELGKLFNLEDSNKLKDDIEKLKKLFPEKEYIPHPIPYNPPIIIERSPYHPPFKYWEITCGNDTVFANPKWDNGTTLSINLSNLTNKTV